MTIPTDLAGCTLWLDADDITKIYKDAGVTNVSADGDVVGRWADKSGGSNHFNQTGADGIKPLYKTNILGGKAGILADGSDDYLIGPAQLTFVGANPYPYTIVAVIKPVTLNTNDANTYNNDAFIADQGGYWGLYGKSAPTLHAFHYAGGDYKTTHSVTTNTPYIFAMWHTGGVLYSSLNNGTAQNVTVAGVVRANLVNLFKGYAAVYINGYIMELSIHNNSLSDADRGALITSFNSKWNVWSTGLGQVI